MINDRDELRKMVEDGSAVKDMLANSSGWAVIKKMAEQRRREAFEVWSAMSEEVDSKKAVQLKLTEKALREFMDEIQEKVVVGISAAHRLQELDEEDRYSKAEELEDATVPEEIKRLTASSLSSFAEVKQFLKEQLPSVFDRAQPQQQ